MKNVIEKKWITKSGLRAEVLFNLFSGFRCGYVYIPENHPLYGVDFWDMDDINVHGGVTYSDNSKEDNTWKIGFDCGHAYDGIDIESLEKHLPECTYEDKCEKYKAMNSLSGGEIRTKEYVTEQCELLAKQLKERV